MIVLPVISFSQTNLTPELLWKLGRINPIGVSKNKQYIIYSVATPDASLNKSATKTYRIPVNGGNAEEINNADTLVYNPHVSPDGKWKLSDSEVKIMNVYGSDFYPDLTKSNVQIYNSLMYRHWDTWEDGKFSHIFLSSTNDVTKKDLMEGQPYDCPQKPFGGDEDYIWNPDGKHVVYVTKQKQGTAYAISTNTDLFEYTVETGETKNLTEGMMGYDVNPSYNKKGELAWLSMKREGYEADKNDLIVSNGIAKMNLTSGDDKINVESFKWSDDGSKIYFIAPLDGTLQLFEVNYPGKTKMAAVIHQITKGDFDVSGIIGEIGNTLFVTRTDFNHAAEIYALDLKSGALQQITHVNDGMYKTIAMISWQKKICYYNR